MASGPGACARFAERYKSCPVHTSVLPRFALLLPSVASIVPPSVPIVDCPPAGSANVPPPLAVISFVCLGGPMSSAPPIVGFNSSYRPLLLPATSARPFVGLDKTTLVVLPCLNPVAPVTTPAPADDRSLYDDNPAQASSVSTTSEFHPELVAKMQVEYRTFDMRRVPRFQSLQFAPSTDRTIATHILCDRYTTTILVSSTSQTPPGLSPWTHQHGPPIGTPLS